MKHNEEKLFNTRSTSKRPSITGLNCRLLTSFDGPMTYVLRISTINTV